LEATAEALASLIRQQEAAGRSFAAGDLYGTNDPRCHGAGLEDLILATPMVRDGRAFCFTALAASHVALDRASLAAVGSLRREGLILPWTRVRRGNAILPELLDLLAANVEGPAEFLEDLQVQVHSVHLGQAVMDGLVKGQSPESLVSVWEGLDAGMRQALRGILDRLGAEPAEGRVGPFTIRIRLEGDGLLVSVEVDDPALRRCLTPTLTRAAVRAAFREILMAELPGTSIVGGWGDMIRAEVRPVARVPDLAKGPARFADAQGLADTILAAIGTRMPHLSRAPDACPVLLDLRGEREDGSRYRARLGLGAGLGASVFGDGMTHATPPLHPQHLLSVEELERATPLRVLRFELRPDSAGPGQYRGGVGALLALELLEGRAEVDVHLPGRPMGLRGGMRGASARLALVTPREGIREEEGPARVPLCLWPGHRLILESPGGGGWGLPFQRSIMRIEEDLARGLISPGQARTRYGVVLKPDTLEKDDHLTYRVRHYLLSTLAAEDIIAGEELLD
jgi:N-methylhydantoinase B